MESSWERTVSLHLDHGSPGSRILATGLFLSRFFDACCRGRLGRGCLGRGEGHYKYWRKGVTSWEDSDVKSGRSRESIRLEDTVGEGEGRRVEVRGYLLT